MSTATIEIPAGISLRRKTPPQECAALDVSRTADYLGCGRTTVYELSKRGLIKSVQIGKRRIFLRASLDEYLLSVAA